MKKRKLITAGFAICLLVVVSMSFVGCATEKAAIAPEDLMYAGLVKSLNDKEIIIEQSDGYDFGAQKAILSRQDSTKINPKSLDLAQGAYIIAYYNDYIIKDGVLSGQANEISIITPRGETAVQTGVVTEITKPDNDEDPYRFTVTAADSEEFIMVCPITSLDCVRVEDIQLGTEVSAITRGVHSVHQPPQYYVLKLFALDGVEQKLLSPLS